MLCALHSASYPNTDAAIIMPTPDQAVVEEIGTAIGLEYNDNEELKSVDKIEERDRHRWELDPASSEDYQDRARTRPK